MRSTSSSDTEEGEERAAGFVLFCKNQGHRSFLLLRHRNGGHWAFPKGRLEPGEEEFAAAVREISEETGIDRLRLIPGFRETSRYCLQRNGHPIHKTVAYYLAEASLPQITLSAEHTDYRWLCFADARALLTYEESRNILDTANLLLDQRVSECDHEYARVYPFGK